MKMSRKLLALLLSAMMLLSLMSVGTFSASALTLENGQADRLSSKVKSTTVTDADHLIFDVVTLTFQNADCTNYGVSWMTYKESTAPVVQIVAGTATNASDFASATTVAATTTTDTDSVCLNYDPEDNWSYSNTGSVEKITEYIHRATLSGLQNSTTYSYRVGDSTANQWGAIYTFTTRAASIGDFSFIFLSDTQYVLDDGALASQQFRSVLTAAKTQAGGNPAFILHGGDILDQNNRIHLWGAVYASNGSEFFTNLPMFGATGNHDRTSSYYNHWNNGQTTPYYSYNYGDVHVIVLANGTDGTADDLGKTQLAWLEADLAANTSARWTIVTLHRPIYSCMVYNQNASVKWSEGGQAGLRTQLSDLFAEYGVDLVLQAHTHQYTHTYPISALNTPQTDVTTVTENGVSYYQDPEGPVYAVIGTAGTYDDPVYTDGDEYPYTAIAARGKDFSFATVDVTSDTLTVNASYVDSGTTKSIERYGIKLTSDPGEDDPGEDDPKEPSNTVSVALEGKVGVNFHLDVGAYVDVAKNPDAQVKITYNKNTTSYDSDRSTDTVRVGDITADANGTYPFEIQVLPAQICDPIDIQLVNDDEVLWERTDFSVKEYCDYFINMVNEKGGDATTSDLSLKELCEATINYGAASQTYFNYNASNLATEGGDYGTLQAFDNPGHKNVTKGSNVQSLSVSMVALNEISLRFNFTLKNGEKLSDSTFTLDNPVGTVAYGKSGSREYIEISGINSAELATPFTLTVTGKNNVTTTIVYSVYDFAYSKSINSDKTTSDFGKALYAFGKASRSYFGFSMDLDPWEAGGEDL